MVTTFFRAAETGDTGAGGGGRLSARAKTPGRLAPAGREAGHAGASPVTLPVCAVSDSGVFLSYVMELFLMLLFLYLLSAALILTTAVLSCLPGAPSAPGCLAASGRQARLRQAAAGAPASLRRTRWRGFGLSLRSDA